MVEELGEKSLKKAVVGACVATFNLSDACD
jgi:hypothetical protein